MVIFKIPTLMVFLLTINFLRRQTVGKKDLLKQPYDFSTEVGTFNDRFILTYSNKTLATADFQTLENQVVFRIKIRNKN
jgi:hypothetical protein